MPNNNKQTKKNERYKKKYASIQLSSGHTFHIGKCECHQRPLWREKEKLAAAAAAIIVLSYNITVVVAASIVL